MPFHEWKRNKNLCHVAKNENGKTGDVAKKTERMEFSVFRIIFKNVLESTW